MEVPPRRPRYGAPLYVGRLRPVRQPGSLFRFHMDLLPFRYISSLAILVAVPTARVPGPAEPTLAAQPRSRPSSGAACTPEGFAPAVVGTSTARRLPFQHSLPEPEAYLDIPYPPRAMSH